MIRELVLKMLSWPKIKSSLRHYPKTELKPPCVKFVLKIVINGRTPGIQSNQ